MSIFHYFSEDPNKRAKFIFNLIAPVYNYIDTLLQSSYLEAIDVLSDELEIENKTVLDIGTGTGAWAVKFEQKKAKQITGVDFSDKMLNVSQKKHQTIHFLKANAEDLTQIKDNTYDIVTASYVLHGVKEDRRNIILSEMKRVSKNYVVLHDFMGTTPYFIRFLEFMEKSDYKFFKKNITNELQNLFTNYKAIEIKGGSGLYICKV